ncbi:MAG: hypothetical protein HN390_00460 [Anaerolineae bacterium]|jgi:hypothetical protein|nr:hypothetical protein [Anaerolineae bacterium]MBT7192240.1 hypothetical protein [Anaerolineae bacterium]
MSDFIKNAIAAIADFALFFFLWLYMGIPWYFALLISTLAVMGLWWLLAWIFGWSTYWNRY